MKHSVTKKFVKNDVSEVVKYYACFTVSERYHYVHSYFTGHKSAVCSSLQEVLKRPLLWIACRRHIREVLNLLLGQAKRENIQSPSITLFQWCKYIKKDTTG